MLNDIVLFKSGDQICADAEVIEGRVCVNEALLTGEEDEILKKEKDELYVIIKAKDLCDYIFTITDKSPKKFRFTFTSKLQNIGLNIIQNLYYANMVYVRNSDDIKRIDKRKEYQQEAYVQLKLLDYMAMMAREHMAILPKQYNQISMQAAEVIMLLVKWSRSDQDRYNAAVKHDKQG